MREITPDPTPDPVTETSVVTEVPSGHASGWRAFFSVLLMGLCVSGNARINPADFETRYQWQQMILAVSACSFGALVAACFAIKWRKLDAYWSIVWRLYLVYVVGAFLAGLMHGGNVASYATGAALLAGLLTAFSGTALFFWRNSGTNIFFYVFLVLFGIGMIRVIML
jgi:hypothetical protein